MTRVQLINWIGILVLAFFTIFSGIHALQGNSYPIDPLTGVGFGLGGMLYFIVNMKRQRKLHCSIVSLFMILGFTIIRTSWGHFTKRDSLQLLVAFWFAYGPALDVVRELRRQLPSSNLH